MFKVKDEVTYKNKCMVVMDIKGSMCEVKDIMTGDIFNVRNRDLEVSNNCLDYFYKYGEIEFE